MRDNENIGETNSEVKKRIISESLRFPKHKKVKFSVITDAKIISPELTQLLTCLLEKDPEKRIKLDNVAKSDWVNIS